MQQALEHIDEGAASSSIVPTTFDLQGEVQGPPFSVGLASNSDRNEKREKRKREKRRQSRWQSRQPAEELHDAPLLLPERILLPCPNRERLKYQKEQVLNLAVDYNKSGVVNAILNSNYGPKRKALEGWFPKKNQKYNKEAIDLLLQKYSKGSQPYGKRE